MSRRAQTWGYARAALLMAAALAALSYLDVSTRSGGGTRLTAAIFDPLYPEDPGFHGDVAGLLEAHGYEVHSVTGSAATPERLARMSRKDILLLRVHSTCSGGGVWILTGEEYSPDRYVLEQVADEVHRARPSIGSRHVFAVGSGFVRRLMAGSLRGTVVLLMGCDGLKSEDLAAAFTGCGASAVVSWDGPVTLPRTDRAFLLLVEALIEGGMTLREAAAYAGAASGPEQGYNSTLRVYPEGAANLKLG